jgi:chromosome segregation ATPase
MSETNRNRDTTQDLIYHELKNIHGTLASIYANPSEQAKLIPHLEKIGKHIVDHLASIDERLCEANGLLYDTKQKHNILLEEKRLKMLRQQNDEMRDVLEKVYTKACKLVAMKEKDGNLGETLNYVVRWDKAISIAKDIENDIPSKYLPFGES